MSKVGTTSKDESGRGQQQEEREPKPRTPTAQGFLSAFPVADSCITLDACLYKMSTC